MSRNFGHQFRGIERAPIPRNRTCGRSRQNANITFFFSLLQCSADLFCSWVPQHGDDKWCYDTAYFPQQHMHSHGFLKFYLRFPDDFVPTIFDILGHLASMGIDVC